MSSNVAVGVRDPAPKNEAVCPRHQQSDDSCHPSEDISQPVREVLSLRFRNGVLGTNMSAWPHWSFPSLNDLLSPRGTVIPSALAVLSLRNGVRYEGWC